MSRASTTEAMVLADQTRATRRALGLLEHAWPWGTPAVDEPAAPPEGPADALLRLPTPRGQVQVAVASRSRPVPPALARPLAAGLVAAGQAAAADGVLVAAPWLSPQTRRVLEQAGAGYADETGNLLLVIADPPVYVARQGADRDPAPRGRRVRGLGGPRAGEVVRTLLDVTPPYRLEDLVAAIGGGINPGYVSRVLAGLAEADLIRRLPRGAVTDVDVRGLLDAWTASYRMLDANAPHGFVELGGPRAAAARLTRLGAAAPGRWAATASLAAAVLAPVAAPALAVVYAERPAALAEAAGLLPADDNPNVLLLAPYSPIVFERVWAADGMVCVAAAQAAADLLGGPGRMPQEAQALLDWMDANRQRWRAPDLATAPPLSTAGPAA